MSKTVTSKVTDADWEYPLKNFNKDGWLQVDYETPHQIYWSEYGNPVGEPVMFLHGGPGGGCIPKFSLFFNPTRYRVILYDQRGCGKSIPSVAKDGSQLALTNNTTNDLVDDILKLRNALNIKGKMHVFGGSWGSTLAMAYAVKYPETVETLILRGIYFGQKDELDYMYQGNASIYAEEPYSITASGAYLIYPEAWKHFVEIIAPEKRGDMVMAYKEIFDKVPTNEAEQIFQTKAAIAWSVWEGVISNLIPDMHDVGKFNDAEFAISFAQIEAHFFANKVFMQDGSLIANVSRFAHIPTYIVHGRHDHVCPLYKAESLVAALKMVNARLVSYTITIAGHSAFERENYHALTAVMDGLPPMKHSL